MIRDTYTRYQIQISELQSNSTFFATQKAKHIKLMSINYHMMFVSQSRTFYHSAFLATLYICTILVYRIGLYCQMLPLMAGNHLTKTYLHSHSDLCCSALLFLHM